MYISYHATTVEKQAVVTAEINLTTFNVPLNAFEIELFFDARNAEIVSVQAHPKLTAEQFNLEQTIDNERGVIYVSCGSGQPFIAGAELTPVLTIKLRTPLDVAPALDFGSRTGFHIHDAFGARDVARIVDGVV